VVGCGGHERKTHVSSSELDRSSKNERTLSLPLSFSRILRRVLLASLMDSTPRESRCWLEHVEICTPALTEDRNLLRRRGEQGRQDVSLLFSKSPPACVGGRCRREPLISHLFSQIFFSTPPPPAPSKSYPLFLFLFLFSSTPLHSTPLHSTPQPAPRPRSTRPTTAPPGPRRSGPAPPCGSAPSCSTPPPT